MDELDEFLESMAFLGSFPSHFSHQIRAAEGLKEAVQVFKDPTGDPLGFLQMSTCPLGNGYPW